MYVSCKRCTNAVCALYTNKGKLVLGNAHAFNVMCRIGMFCKICTSFHDLISGAKYALILHDLICCAKYAHVLQYALMHRISKIGQNRGNGLLV